MPSDGKPSASKLSGGAAGPGSEAVPTRVPAEGSGGSSSAGRPLGLLRAGPRGVGLAAEPGGRPSCRLRSRVLLALLAVEDTAEGAWARVLTPCERQGWVSLDEGTRMWARVVLDPGHGGDELGAVGPGGLQEKELNLDVARRAAEALQAEGVEVALTRGDDYRATLTFRASLAAAACADALVSVHHNAEPDGPHDGPGTEIYYQLRSACSKRLAGLLYEEMVGALRPFDAEWVGNADAGAKWRLNHLDEDYYGILRRTGSLRVTAVLAEPAFLSNPTEEKLLRQPVVRQAQAVALSRAILRFLGTADPGSGFTTPGPRHRPAGSGGGPEGCIDPS